MDVKSNDLELMHSFFPKWLLLTAFILIPFVSSQLVWDNYTVPKWILIYAVSFFVGVYCLFAKGLVLPRLSNLEKSLLAVIILCHVLHFLQPNIPFFDLPHLERLCFWLIIFFCFNIFSKRLLLFDSILKSIEISAIIFCLIALPKMFLVANLDFFKSFDLSLSFGNINMAAEFIGFGILLHFSRLLNEPKVRFRSLYTISFFVMALYLYFSGSRSCWLGVLIGIAYLFFAHSKKKFKSFLVICIIAVCSILVASRYYSGADYFKGKIGIFTSSTNERFDTWKQSLRMLIDQPFGVGPGGFEFGFIPYQIKGELGVAEESILKNPHNEFLRFAVEDGLLVLCAGIMLLILLIKRSRNNLSREELASVTLILIFLFVQSIFQFPLENAFPFLLAAVTIGFLASKLFSEKLVARQRTFKLLFCVFLLYVGTTSTRFVLSKYYEANSESSLDQLNKGCTLFPSNWRICLDAAQGFIDSGQLEKAADILNAELNRNKYNFSAIRVYSVLSFVRNDQKEACGALWVFHEILSRKKTEPGEIKIYCGADYISNVRDLRFLRDYPALREVGEREIPR